jgi:hypothetical protein
MSWASVVAARLRGLFEHKRLECELDEGDMRRYAASEAWSV